MLNSLVFFILLCNNDKSMKKTYLWLHFQSSSWGAAVLLLWSELVVRLTFFSKFIPCLLWWTLQILQYPTPFASQPYFPWQRYCYLRLQKWLLSTFCPFDVLSLSTFWDSTLWHLTFCLSIFLSLNLSSNPYKQNSLAKPIFLVISPAIFFMNSSTVYVRNNSTNFL